VEELKEKLKSLNALCTSQLQSMHNVVYAHEAISSSTLKALDNTVSAHPFALEEVCQLEPTQSWKPTSSLSFPVLFPFCLYLFLCLVFVVGSVASQ
jgi:hypothetical protein